MLALLNFDSLIPSLVRPNSHARTYVSFFGDLHISNPTLFVHYSHVYLSWIDPARLVCDARICSHRFVIGECKCGEKTFTIGFLNLKLEQSQLQTHRDSPLGPLRFGGLAFVPHSSPCWQKITDVLLKTWQPLRIWVISVEVQRLFPRDSR